MPTLTLQTTEFTLSLLPNRNRHWATVKLAVKNEHIFYDNTEKTISFEELERLIFSLSRMLAGGYDRERSLTFERAGIAVDLYPYEDGNRVISRAERRERDCVAVVRLLMKSKDEKSFLNGVFSLILHREDIKIFVDGLRKEYAENYARRVRGSGKCHFVGVSPLGYEGCNYWYFDPSKEVRAGEYVWVRMGRHDTEQIVYVDNDRRFHSWNAPYDPERVKRVLRKATPEEIAKLQEKR